MELAASERARQPQMQRAAQVAFRLTKQGPEVDDAEQGCLLELVRRSRSNMAPDTSISNTTNRRRRQKKRQRGSLDDHDSSLDRLDSMLLSRTEMQESRVRSKRATMVVMRALDLREHAGACILDLSGVLSLIKDEVLWELGGNLPRVTQLVLHDWTSLRLSSLRSLSLGFGERLDTLDLSGCPISDEMVAMIAARFVALRCIVLRRCTALTNGAVRAVAEAGRATLKSLDVSACPLVTEDALAWLAGAIGAGGLPCSALQSLSAEGCSRVRDAGLVALGGGCKGLRFLNLSRCPLLTSAGVAALARGCRRLQVLHLAECSLVGDLALAALGASCLGLRSVSLARCAAVTDGGLRALCRSAKALQALNVAGCVRITELGVFFLVSNNKALQMLNVTGCELVSQRGLQEMTRGLRFVELAKSYSGFKPREGAKRLKLDAQLRLARDDASRLVAAALRGHGTRRRLARERLQVMQADAVLRLQSLVLGRLGRRKVAKLRLRGEEHRAAALLQCAWRDRAGRLVCLAMRLLRRRDEAVAPHATVVQAAFRGRKTRRTHPEVVALLEQLHEDRWEEALSAVVVRMQALSRGKLSASRNLARMEELQQRRNDMASAAKVLQSVSRRKAAYRRAGRLRELFNVNFAKELRAATHVQRIVRGRNGRRDFREVCRLRQLELERTTVAARLVQKVHRGYLGRVIVQARRREAARQACAARELQRMARGRAVPHWRVLRFEEAKRVVLQRSEEARKAACREVEERLRLHNLGLERDSASGDDEPENAEGGGGGGGGGGDGDGDSNDGEYDDWQEHWDPDMMQTFYFSPSRNLRSMERYITDEFEQSLLDCLVRVLDVSLQRWRDALVTKYNRKKHKHKIEFYDYEPTSFTKDHEWLRVKEDEARVQIYDNASETWTMLRSLRVSLLRTTDIDAASDPFVERLLDEDSGQYFYHDVRTGQTSWEAPLA